MRNHILPLALAALALVACDDDATAPVAGTLDVPATVTVTSR